MKRTIFITFCLLCQIFAFGQWNTERILAIGQNALYFEDYVLSIQYFNQVIKIKPYLAEPYMFRGMAKVQLGDYQGADQDCSEAIERNPFLAQAYYTRGFARQKMDFYPEAIADFTKALEFSPNSLNLLLNRMDTYEKNKEYQNAMNDLEQYQKLGPKNNNLYYEKGLLQLQMKDTLAAENTFNEFIKIDSTNCLGWSARGILRMQRNDKKGAYADYSQAIKNGSTYFGDYINRGILNVERKNYRESLTDYDQAIKLNNKSDLAYYNRGLLRANLGDRNNALSDLTKVLQLDSSNTEALLSKAMLEVTLRQYRTAINDYKSIIKKYPYFIPGYISIAESEEALGNQKEGFRYRQMAYNLENNKEYIKRKHKDNLSTANKMANNTQKSSTSSKTELFNRFATQNLDDAQTESKYTDATRGTVQDKYVDVVNERNFVLSFYAKSNEIRRTNIFYPLLEQYNKTKKLRSILKITNNEIPLTAELINSHFESINAISGLLSNDSKDADIYFNRALEFSLVQDFNSSIEDLNRAIELRPDFMLAYFCRANIRNKLLEYTNSAANLRNELETQNGKIGLKNNKLSDKQYQFEVGLILNDYDRVSSLNPDFSFAYYNKANLLCTQKDFRAAISNYSRAIDIDPDFAEAYFNRGLTYLFIGEDGKGLADLSKAGELGIYQAYNLLQRFKK